MDSAAAEIARRLSREAEAVCRHYLSNGRRQGRYWIVGDIENTPGSSLYVRLAGPARAATRAQVVTPTIAAPIPAKTSVQVSPAPPIPERPLMAWNPAMPTGSA